VSGLVYTSPLKKRFEFRKPTLKEWFEYEARKLESIESLGVATRELLQVTRETPSLEELQAHFERFPASPAAIVEKLKPLLGDDIPVELVGDDPDASFVVSKTRSGKPLKFRCPTLAEWESYQTRYRKLGRVAFCDLAQMTRLEVSETELAAHFEDAPIAAENIANRVAELAGADADVTAKKG
jgi:hypothetical protein